MSIREFRRIEFRSPVEFSTLTGKFIESCMALDLSEGGIRFNSNQFVPLDTDMNLQFRLNSDRVYNLHGKVVWVQKVPHSEESYQIGLEFDNRDFGTQPKGDIKEFVKSHRF